MAQSAAESAPLPSRRPPPPGNIAVSKLLEVVVRYVSDDMARQTTWHPVKEVAG